MTAACSFLGRKSHFTFNWTIENAHALLVSNKPIYSPIFIVHSIEETKWKLSLYRTWGSGINFDIEREKDNGPETIEVEVELSILTADGSPIAMERSREKFASTTESLTYVVKNLEEIYVKRAAFLPNDALLVRCRMWRTGTEIKDDTCYARTRLNVDRRSFVWAIREFSCLQQKKEIIRVLKPVSEGFPEFVLNLHLNTNFKKKYVLIRFNMTEAGRRNTFCLFSLLDSERRVIETEHFKNEENTENLGINEKPDSIHYDSDCIFFYVCEYDKVLNDKVLLQDDVLYIKCEILIEVDLACNQIEHYRSEISNDYLSCPYESFTSISPFKAAFEDLYLDESLSDVILQADGKSFHGHKMILSTRSPIFKAMMSQDIPDNIINIPDMKADTLRHLLLYIYKDIVEETRCEKVMDLFRAADTYELWDLRKKCSFILKSSIFGDNVCQILSLAKAYSDRNLKKAAENFISDKDNLVLSSDGWLKLKEENLQLALEVMEQLMIN